MWNYWYHICNKIIVNKTYHILYVVCFPPSVMKRQLNSLTELIICFDTGWEEPYFFLKSQHYQHDDRTIHKLRWRINFIPLETMYVMKKQLNLLTEFQFVSVRRTGKFIETWNLCLLLNTNFVTCPINLIVSWYTFYLLNGLRTIPEGGKLILQPLITTKKALQKLFN